MYHHLKGDLVDLSPTSAVVDVGGVGYDLRIPLSTYDALKGNKVVSLYTHFYVREDDMRLFGFATSAERELFRFLLSVSGVGPSIALAALCALPPRDIARAISEEDLETLQKIRGVGRKLAERLALELRDRIGSLLVLLGVDRQPATSARDAGKDRRAAVDGPPEVLEAVEALLALGFDRKSALERVERAFRRLRGEGTPPAPLPVEKLIKESLRSK